MRSQPSHEAQVHEESGRKPLLFASSGSRPQGIRVGQLLAILLIEVLLAPPGMGRMAPFPAVSSPSPQTRIEPVVPEPAGTTSAGDTAMRSSLLAAPDLKQTARARTATFTDLSISVAYADDSSPTPNFPIPWMGSPSVVYIGTGSPLNAGAIRIDNRGATPAEVDSVVVDLQRTGENFDSPGKFGDSYGYRARQF